MEISEKAVVGKINIELFNDILNYKKLAMFDSFLECSLDVPEHQVLQFFVFCKDFLETFKVRILNALDHGTSFGHKFHELISISGLQCFDFLPKPP